MRTLLSALLILLVNSVAPSASAFSPQVEPPEACWDTESEEGYKYGHFSFDFDSRKISSVQLAIFLEEIQDSDLRMTKIYSYSDENLISVEVGVPKKHPRTPSYRRNINKFLNELRKTTPGITDFDCAYEEQEEQEEGPGTDTGTFR